MQAPPDSDKLMDLSLARVFRIMERLRFVGAGVLGTLAVLFGAHDEPAWKPLVAGAAALALVALALRDLGRRREIYAPGDVVRVLGSILGAQLLAITLTGGIRSPLLVVAPPIVLGLAIGTARSGRVAFVFAAIVAVIATLGLGDVFGLWPPRLLVPDALARDDDARAVGYALAATLAFTLFTLVAAKVGTFLRRTVQDAITHAERARAEVLEATRARHRELEALSGALAHELKNPLASIRGLAVLLARKLPDGSQEAERMGVLLGEVQRMGHILDEFLNFSRPAEGLATSVVPAERLIADVFALHEGQAALRDVRLRADVRTAATLLVDPRKLEQVLVNFVQNALEASPPGGAVTLRARDDGADVVFEVLDEGQGLAPAIAGRLFTVGATTKAAGTGLGLVIARGIAEQHGGRVALEPRADAPGCVARLTVPRVPAAGAP